ncbi:hypothetical protein GCM10027578_45230 [Spirosoma luteolum]
MQSVHLIPVRDFCVYHQVEITFVDTLVDTGLIETTVVNDTVYVAPTQLTQLEKLVRLHRDLHIHVTDLDVVASLLDRMESLQDQLLSLQNRLRFYER